MTHRTLCRNVISIEYKASAGFEFCTVWLKTYNFISFTNFEHKSFIFFKISTGFILKILQISQILASVFTDKMYSYKMKGVVGYLIVYNYA